ncbi:MAG TPA: hypothetical protein DDW52_12060 [Planctomycetaceae bacterium]|nr:hypothetical protein [Planctomycetaceae bacterium]
MLRSCNFWLKALHGNSSARLQAKWIHSESMQAVPARDHAQEACEWEASLAFATRENVVPAKHWQRHSCVFSGAAA